MEIIINDKRHGDKVCLVDDEDYEYLNKFKWGVVKRKNTFYASRTQHYKDGSRKKMMLIHRLILGLSDPKIFVDHVDHNGLNNQKSNLRICTNQENQRNTSLNNKKTLNSSSKYKGVSWYKRDNKWRANICVGKDVYLGSFINETDAAKAYDRAALKYFGEFACLNFPELLENYKDVD